MDKFQYYAEKMIRLYEKYIWRYAQYYENKDKRIDRLRKRYDILENEYQKRMAESFNQYKKYDAYILDSILNIGLPYSTFPQKLMYGMFKNKITQEPNDIETYEKFINYMNFFGPRWDEPKKEISKAIKNNDFERAYLIAMNVKSYEDYDADSATRNNG